MIIRRFHADDWKGVYAYMSDPEVVRRLPESLFTEADARKFIQENMGEDARNFPVVLKGENRLIGHMVYHVLVKGFFMNGESP